METPKYKLYALRLRGYILATTPEEAAEKYAAGEYATQDHKITEKGLLSRQPKEAK